MAPLSYDDWISDYLASGQARKAYDKYLRKHADQAAVARQSFPSPASRAGFSVAEVVARVPSSVFAVGGMGAVAPMVTRVRAR